MSVFPAFLNTVNSFDISLNLEVTNLYCSVDLKVQLFALIMTQCCDCYVAKCCIENLMQSLVFNGLIVIYLFSQCLFYVLPVLCFTCFIFVLFGLNYVALWPRGQGTRLPLQRSSVDIRVRACDSW